MRTRQSFLNFLANEGSHFLNIILSFACRTVFIYMLGKEYLGVSSLFNNVLTMLNLAELGVGGAIIFNMYKPIAEEDRVTQRQLMNMYKKLYRIVACVIAVAGLALVPALPYLIADKPDIDWTTLRTIYLLYLFNTVSSYFFSYKRSIIDAHQRAYIGTIINTVYTFIQFTVQMLVLVLTKNFIAYLLVQIVCNVMTNITVAIKANHDYPYINENRKELPPPEMKKSIYKKVGAMFIHKLGSVVVNDTDNLIMSAFIGVATVGIYSNYQSLQYSVNVALNGVFGAFTASIGNLGAIKDKKRMFEVYNTLQFLSFWFYSFSTIAFLIMYNPFIEVWIGEEYLFPMSIVFIICACFYVSGMRVVTLTFRDAMGLFWYDRYKPIFEIIINLTASLYLVNKIGVVGIFLGTLISTFTTSWWVEPYVTYKHGFEQPISHFFKLYFRYLAVVTAGGAATYYVCSLFTMGGVAEVILKLLVCIVMYNGIIILLFHRTREFKEVWERGISMAKAMLARKQ